MRKKLVQYGAGNIGRSLTGQIFSRAGWEVVFIDVARDIVEALNRHRRYRVVIKEEEPGEVWVEGVRGVLGSDLSAVSQEIATCDLLCTAVGAKILPLIAEPIAKGLVRRSQPLDIVLCENLRGAPQVMKSCLLEHLPEDFPLEERVGLVATSIGKMVPIMPESVRQTNPLEVWAEAYNQVIFDREAFLGEIPPVEGLVGKKCFEAYVDQKLFVHNMGHALTAYLGDRAGAATIAQAMENDRVARTVRRAMNESGQALVSLYSQELETEEMCAYIEDLLRRFRNTALGDTVYRVGRDRPRKFAREDRLIGSLTAQRKAGVDSSNTLEGIAAGFLFSACGPNGERLEADEEFDRVFKEKGVHGVLVRYSELDPERDAAWFEKLSSLVGS